MSWGEREQRQILNFFLVFVRLFRLQRFASWVRPLLEPTPKFWLSSHCPGSCSLTSLSCHFSEPTNFHTRVVPWLPPGVGGRTYPFPVVPHLCRRFGTSSFFKYFLITVVIHSWLADPQQEFRPKSIRGQLTVLVDSLFDFYYYYFSFALFFPRNSLYNLDLSYHVTDCVL